MAILVGIDGTGAVSDVEYRRDMMQSFVHRIVHNTSNPARLYLRGPDTVEFLTGLRSLVYQAESFVVQQRNFYPDAPILLTGYSRGGAGVIWLAKLLHDRGFRVRAMLLFDAVNRAAGDFTDWIPNNVEHVRHALRSVSHTQSRSTFGHTGTHHSPPTTYEPMYFDGTHGAMGGVPWQGGPGDVISENKVGTLPPLNQTRVTHAEDQAVSLHVWGWVQPFIGKFGF